MYLNRRVFVMILKCGLRGSKLYKYDYVMIVPLGPLLSVDILQYQMNGNDRKRTLDMCAERRPNSPCAFSQSDQNLHWVHFRIANITKTRLFKYTKKKLKKKKRNIR